MSVFVLSRSIEWHVKKWNPTCILAARTNLGLRTLYTKYTHAAYTYENIRRMGKVWPYVAQHYSQHIDSPGLKHPITNTHVSGYLFGNCRDFWRKPFCPQPPSNNFFLLKVLLIMTYPVVAKQFIQCKDSVPPIPWLDLLFETWPGLFNILFKCLVHGIIDGTHA